MMRTYHVGLLQVKRVAVFQFCRSVDELDCEILEYLGERETTKRVARARLAATKEKVLSQLGRDYPHRFDNVRVA